MGPGAVQMYIDMEIPCRFTSWHFRLEAGRDHAPSQLWGAPILERNNLTEIGLCTPEMPRTGGELHNWL